MNTNVGKHYLTFLLCGVDCFFIFLNKKTPVKHEVRQVSLLMVLLLINMVVEPY